MDNKVELVPVILGKDYGTEVEVLSGIRPRRLDHHESGGLADVGRGGAPGSGRRASQ